MAQQAQDRGLKQRSFGLMLGVWWVLLQDLQRRIEAVLVLLSAGQEHRGCRGCLQTRLGQELNRLVVAGIAAAPELLQMCFGCGQRALHGP